MANRSVVVVGGGYAGVSVAKGLDHRAEVTLVEPRDAFVHNVAALRSLVHPEWAHNMFLSYDHLLAQGTVVHEWAVEVDVGRVVLQSGRVLDAEVVVLATGSRYPYPAKPSSPSSEHALDAMLGTFTDLERAARVLIAGAGAVGVELAAEIKLRWPEKSVVIVDAADVLGATAHSDRLRAELRGQLTELGVELRLGDAVTQLPNVPPARRGAVSAVTASGAALSADIWFKCFGVRPASDPLRGSLTAARRPDGCVVVDEFLRVEGAETVYALGDVSTADAKMAGLAMIQAGIVAANVKAHLRGEAPTKRYRPIGPMIMVAIGPDGGAGESPAGFHDRDEVVAMKSRDLLVEFFRDLLGLDAAPLIAD